MNDDSAGEIERVVDARLAMARRVAAWRPAEQTALEAEIEDVPVCDHPGLDHSDSWSYCWPCPKCGVCKFIGHGPLCGDCALLTRPGGEG